MGTAISYQGFLELSGAPLTDTADFEFTLWDDPSAGSPIGATASVGPVGVEDGLFILQVPFGPEPFVPNEARWLEIQVRSPSGSGPFTTLSPRQELTPTPHSLSTRGLSVDADGNVGIGTPSPAAKLDVMGTALVGGFRMPPGAVGGYVLTTDDFGVANWQPPGEFTLPFPVARYRHFSGADIAAEMETCDQTFYSLRNTLRRVWGSLWHRRQPLIALVANLSYRGNLRQSRKNCRDFLAARRHVAGDDRRPGLSSERPRVPYAACATPLSGMVDE